MGRYPEGGMKIRLENGLPVVSGSITVAGKTVELQHALLDTGSGGTLVSADRLLEVGVEVDPTDRIVSVRGVGGLEFVVRKPASTIRLGDLAVHDVPVQIGSMDYGFDLDAIVGTDVLHSVGAVIDLGALELRGPADGRK